MMTLRIKLALLLAMAFGVLMISNSAVSAVGNKQHVKADTLTGYQETPQAISSPGTGTFEADIDLNTGAITYALTYSDLTAPAAVAHIHFGTRTQTGGVAAFLCGGGGKPACPAGTTTEAVVTGVIMPSDVVGPTGQGIGTGEIDELILAIRSGVTYVNVHTPTWPGGEIRGQVNNDNQRQP